MGIMSWDPDGSGFNTALPNLVRTPRLTVRYEYPDTGSAPTEVSFRLSPRYGIHDALEAHDWFLRMMQEHEEFVVENG